MTQRPIKFKAWDKKNNVWLDPEEVFGDWGGSEWFNAACMNDKLEFELRDSGEEIAWMQFTGLTDKNGKEIYEGDIVKEIEEYWGREDVLEVRWQILGFYPNRLRDGGFEVIGNIYENPELLERKS